MARIFQFPERRSEQRDCAGQRPIGGMEHTWRELWENPLTQAAYRLFIAFVVCTWPVLQWFVGVDLFIQLLRMVFVGGFAGLAALMHFLVVGIVTCLVLYVPPLPHRWVEQMNTLRLTLAE